MSESETDLDIFKFLWFIQGGEFVLRRDGINALSISRNGPDPEIDILDINSLRTLVPPINPAYMERMRKISRELAASGKNLRVMVDGDFFLNMGSKGTVLKDLEGFAGMFMNRISKFIKMKK